MTVQAAPDTVPAAGTSGGAVPHTADLLAYLPSPPQGVWEIGPFPLRAYAVCIIVGIVVAIWWGEKRWRARGGEAGTVLDVAVFAVPFGLIGGRTYHVATDWQKYFGADGNAMDALKIYQGGLGIWGAVLFGGIGAWIACRIYKIPLPALGDAIAPPILLAQAIGRLGNYFNQELYGRETDLPWGLEIYLRFDDAGRLDMMNGVSSGEVHSVVHPTFLYELVWNVAVVLALVYVDRRFRIGHGRLFALYVAGYCFGRFFVELMRDDEATQIAGIRINSFTSALVFFAAVAYFLFATKGRETPAQLSPDAGPRPWPWQLGALRAAGGSTGVGLTKTTAVGGDSDGGATTGDDDGDNTAAEGGDTPAESDDTDTIGVTGSKEEGGAAADTEAEAGEKPGTASSAEATGRESTSTPDETSDEKKAEADGENAESAAPRAN